MLDLENFKKLEYLNKGSFSEIYKAQNKHTQEFVALKIYHKVILKNRKRFDFVQKKYADFSYIPRKEVDFFTKFMKERPEYVDFCVKYFGYSQDKEHVYLFLEISEKQ